MQTTQNIHTPIPRQLLIKNICLQVERQFGGRLSPEGFCLRFFLLLLFFFDFTAGDGFLTSFLPPYALFLLRAAFAYYGLTLLAKRFRDLGKGGANLLQILIPLFVLVWIGGKVPEKYSAGFEAILWLWPALTLLRLCLQPSAPETSDQAPPAP